MIIHSDVLTYRHFEDAAAFAGVKVIELERSGSRTRHAKFKFSLLGSSPYQRGFGASKNGEKAATWDEWGIFFNRLFMLDPQAHCGDKHSYRSEEDFHWKTGGRFHTLAPRNQHWRHKWQPLGMVSNDGHCMAVCDCGAETHWKVLPVSQ